MTDASSGENQPKQPGEVPGQSSGEIYDMTVDPRIAGLDADHLDYFSSVASDLIGKRIDGIHYAETRRNQIAVIAGALAAAGIALFTLGRQTQWLPLRVSYFVAACSSILIGVLVWVLFALQTNFRYPFVRPAQTWKWFYWLALPDAARFGPKLYAIQRKSERVAEQEEYKRQWIQFRDQVQGLSDKRINATQDLKQLYLLHVDERYKNLFLTQLRRLLTWGIAAIVSVTLAAFLIALQWGNTSTPPNGSYITHGGVQIKSSWVPTGVVRSVGISDEDVEFRLVMTVTNNSPTTFRASSLIAEDTQGRPIPAIFYVTPGKAFLYPHQSVTFLGYFWISGVDQTRLERIDLK